MIAEGAQGFIGQGIDGVFSDQFFDVQHVPVVRVLGTRAGPQQPLRPGAFFGQRVPARRRVQRLVQLVGRLAVGDGCLADQAPDHGSFLRIVGLLFPFGQQCVDERIDPADEETGHARRAADPSPRGQAVLEPADVGFGHGLVHGPGEQQCYVDIQSLADQPPNGRYARPGRRHLDHDVPAVHFLPQPPGFRDRSRGVIGEFRGYLQAHVTVGAVGGVIHGGQPVGGLPYICNRKCLVDFHGVAALRRQQPDVVVVIRTPRDGFLENGRIRGHALQPVLLDQSAQPAR